MVKNYKCPGCGASMVYDEGSSSMVCPYCGKTVPVSEADGGENEVAAGSDREINSENDFTQKAPEETDAADNDGSGLKAYHCPNCGAEIVADANTAATFCSFCGSPTLIEDRLSGYYRPQEVIPFQIDKEKAKELFLKWTKKGLFTPRRFSQSAMLEKLTGMYLPYWLYDYEVSVQMNAEATRSRIERRGDTEYIYTDHFRINRDVTADYDRIPVNASDKMPQDIMERVEPFQYQDIVEFQMPYLAGFQAEKYSHSREEMQEAARERARQYALQETRATIVGYEAVNVLHTAEQPVPGKAEYAMLPVWLLNYDYQGKHYLLTLNGQTGRIIGKLPVSAARAGITFAILTAVIFGILTLIGGLL